MSEIPALPFLRPLLATEHTEFDSGAERLAFAVAQRHALPLAIVLPEITNAAFETEAPQLSARADRAVAAHAAALREAARTQRVTVDIGVRRGEEPWREIVAEAQRRSADLLIVRRRGRRGFLARLLIGEMVGQAAGHAPCSVLIAPRAATIWQRRVLAAIGGTSSAQAVAHTAAAIARASGLPLSLLRVVESDAADGIGAADAVLQAALSASEAPAASRHVRPGRVAEQILQQAVQEAADLIVIGRQPGTRLGEVAEAVIGGFAGPVLVVRADA